MTLTESIKSEPYLKVSNCSDLSDLDFAIDTCKELENKFGQSKTLDRVWVHLIDKKNKLKSK